MSVTEEVIATKASEEKRRVLGNDIVLRGVKVVEEEF